MKYKVTVSTNKIGSQVSREIEIDDDELAELSVEARENYITEYAQETMHELINWDWDWEEVEDKK